MEIEVMQSAFEYFYHMDCANAAIHRNNVKFSPITFDLAAELRKWWPDYQGIPINLLSCLHHVESHIGKYEMDMGR